MAHTKLTDQEITALPGGPAALAARTAAHAAITAHGATSAQAGEAAKDLRVKMEAVHRAADRPFRQ